MSAHLPMRRVKAIMRSVDGVEKISKEAVTVLARASELLIAQLAKKSHAASTNKKKLDYKDIQGLVHSESKYMFLREMVPRKITVAKYREILAKKKKELSDGEMTEKSEDEEDDEDQSEESSTNESDDESDEEEVEVPIKKTDKSNAEAAAKNKTESPSSTKKSAGVIDLTISDSDSE